MYLNQQRYWLYALRLKGHENFPYAPATRAYEDWRNSVDKGYAIIKAPIIRSDLGLKKERL
jgi:esterase/lipase